MLSRRSFIKMSAATGLFLGVAQYDANLLSGLAKRIVRVWARSAATNTLDPLSIPKYVTPLVIPPALPRIGRIKSRGSEIDYYEIAVRQFNQQILPTGYPATTVWSYGSARHPGTFNYPAFTIETKSGRPVRIKWSNELVDANGNYLPHLLPVDPTLHWANPPGGTAGRDSRPSPADTPTPYTGPVPMVVHVHGAAGVGDESDGYAEAWYLPAAKNIPAGYATQGTWYNAFKAKALAKGFAAPGKRDWAPGTAVFQYPNDQRATTSWYHDHTLGMTRLNVYAGPAGFFLVRGGAGDEVEDKRTGRRAILPGPAPALGDPAGLRYYEIPIAVQDRVFKADSSLFYPDTRTFFDEIPGPYIPNSDVPPIWNPEFFGDTMVVNGKSWPYLDVEQRRYRFRFLNGCNARFLVLKFDYPGLEVWQIGNEGGFLAKPVPIHTLNVGGLGGAMLMCPAERADVIVDFTNVPVGTTITLLNLGPDAPFSGFPIDPDDVANPATTGQVMQFRVRPATSVDRSTPPRFLELPKINKLKGGATRPLALMEMMSMDFADAPVAAMLGTFDRGTGNGVMKMWVDPITENPAKGATEVWEYYNLTADAHPMHIHEAQFQVVDRQVLQGANQATGATRPPEPWENGLKDTVIAYPGEVTRLRIKFNTVGRYVWHCHLVEHEDNEMMRPYAVGPIATPTEMMNSNQVVASDVNEEFEEDSANQKLYVPFVANE